MQTWGSLGELESLHKYTFEFSQSDPTWVFASHMSTKHHFLFMKYIFRLRNVLWHHGISCNGPIIQTVFHFYQHSSAVETLVGIGGIEFFSHLRQDVDPSLYQIIDDILSNLLSLPGDILDGSEECQWLHYESGKKSVVLVPENCVDVHLVTPPGQTHGNIT